MILTILNLLIVSPILWVPLFFYGRKSRRMVKFCQRMARSEYQRTIYSYMLLAIVLMFHATYPELFRCHYGAYASTALAVCLISPKLTTRLLKGIRASHAVMAIIGFMALANVFAPEMYTLGITLCYVLLAAVFYPSQSMEDYVLTEPQYSNYEELEEETVKHYFA